MHGRGRQVGPAIAPDGAGGAIVAWMDDRSGTNNYDVYAQRVCRRPPVLLVPGIAGTYAKDLSNDANWILNRGIAPSQLQIDPLCGAYNSLIQTLRNVGYVLDEPGAVNPNLFVVNYDWRLPLAQDDGVTDGEMSGVSTLDFQIARQDQRFRHGVDYLGESLMRVLDANPDAEYVDVIAHSMGGLLTRCYIESPAYGGTLIDGRKLPKINQFIMVGVPNRGTSKAWNPLHDNWNGDPAYSLVLSKLLARAWLKVKSGLTIDGPTPITLSSITDPLTNLPDPIRLINAYCPSIRSLLATYPFIINTSSSGDVNSDPTERNALLLDLNDGLDLFSTGVFPNDFVDRTTRTTVIYGYGEPTPEAITRKQGPDLLTLNIVQKFIEWYGHNPGSGEEWALDYTSPIINHDFSGDGTVPTISSSRAFRDDVVRLNKFKLELYPAAGAGPQFDVTHLGLLHNQAVENTILIQLCVPFHPSDVCTDQQASWTSTLWSGARVAAGSIVAVWDPVDGFIVDGAGRKLGFSNSSGGLTEIPNSLHFGDQNGIGWVFGAVQEPVTLQLTGRGEDYYVMVSQQADSLWGGMVVSGYLAAGAQAAFPITLSNHSLAAVGGPGPITRLQLNGAYPNPSTAGLHFEVEVPVSADVARLRIFDATGRVVAEPLRAVHGPGRWSVAWTGTDGRGNRLPAGVYLARLQMGSQSVVRRFVLIH